MVLTRHFNGNILLDIHVVFAYTINKYKTYVSSLNKKSRQVYILGLCKFLIFSFTVKVLMINQDSIKLSDLQLMVSLLDTSGLMMLLIVKE